MEPYISVIMSVYNGSQFLKDAVDSILKQTFSNFEFIIFDDCSTDSTLEILESYSDERIKIIKNSDNLGLTCNLNKGIDMGRGKYIARMDADDISLPKRFQKQVSYLDHNSDTAIVGTDIIVLRDGTKLKAGMARDYESIKAGFFFGNQLSHPSIMMRKSALDDLQLRYNTQFKSAQDYELFARCSKVAKLANIKESLIIYRVHDGQISEAKLEEQNKYADLVRRKQLQGFGSNFSDRDIDIFNSFIHRNTKINDAGLMAFDELLQKLVLSNNNYKLYNKSKLNRCIGDYWYYLCKKTLKESGNKTGSYYYSSKSKKYVKGILRKKSAELYFKITESMR